ncbi:hypothetical protein GCM10010215_20480 [Streptomyces virginiae]|uniref:Uncharacterized protein n=1 Tax=Streptomyces virginiae TaxID=1961 RepID=A0ABQ3NQP1_STRVG|nr:hypothetical protein GCM10010215_20480 [Streptomyces virginiae]GHI15073.1 hypothetical protein Scinn_45360 [Streptomyces virginiae]GLV88566.1 hypothetical protein Slala04_00200 [Streptomyces lavendulae subsp. lavendulae]
MGSLIRTASALFSTYETVARDTPARRATSALVGTGGGGGCGGFDDSDMAVASFQNGCAPGLADGLKRMLHSAYTSH